MEVNTSGWKACGETSNTRYFEIAEDVLGGLPFPGSRDTGETARENQAFQNGHWRTRGHPGVVVIFFDNLVSQDKDARRVYQQDPDPVLMLGTALVGGSMLARAIASFFLGLTKPRIPVKMFGNLDDALVWARELNEKARKVEKR
jgi:hypothetical protein